MLQANPALTPNLVKAVLQYTARKEADYGALQQGAGFLDVLNQQQQVFQTRFNLAQSYYNFIVNTLRLKQATGALTEADVDSINQQLRG